MQSKYVLYPLLNLAIGKSRKSRKSRKSGKIKKSSIEKMKMEIVSFKHFL